MGRVGRVWARGLWAVGLLVLQAAQAAPPGGRAPPYIPAPLPAAPAQAPIPMIMPPPRPATAAFAPGATGAAIPLEAFTGAPQMSEPHISPDGRYLVFITTADGQARVEVRELPTGREWRILNASSGPFTVSRCEFKTNERMLCHLEGVVRGGDPQRLYPASHLLAVNADGTRFKVLFSSSFFTRLAPAATSQFQDRIVHWLPADPSHVLIELGDRGSVFPSVYRLDVYSGNLQQVVASRPPVMDWTADPSGVVRFGYGFQDENGVYVARNDPNSPWRTLEEFKRFDRKNRFDPLAFGARPTDLLVFAPYEGRTAVWKMDLDAPAGGMQLVYSRPDVDVGGILEWPTDRHVAGYVYETDRPHTYFTDEHAAAIDAVLERALPGAYHVVIDATRDGGRLVTFSFSDVMPPRYHLLDVASGKLTELGRQVPLSEAQLAPMQSITVAGPGGIAIPGYLTLPRGSEPGAKLPGVVLPHGGPYARDHWAYDPLVQMLASRGYAVLQLNFRGSTGYGEKWRDAGQQAWGTIMSDDITAGAHWLIDQGIVDPQRLAIVGWSYGGYAALIGVEREPRLYRCAVSIAGVSDLSQMALDDERFYGGKDSAGDAMGTDPASLRAQSPLQHVADIHVPVLLVHGEDDYTVLVGHSEAMDRELTRHVVPHELVLIPHGGHSLERPEMRLTLYRKLTEFLGANLRPEPAAPTPAVSGAAATR